MTFGVRSLHAISLLMSSINAPSGDGQLSSANPAVHLERALAGRSPVYSSALEAPP